LLLRHAAHDLAGRALAGRMEGLGLNAQGLQQAHDLAEALQRYGIAALYSSPQLRTRQTAQPLAQRLGLSVAIAPEFDEIDFGDWTGKSIEELRGQGPAWLDWVERRSGATPPGGEPFAQVQRRAAEGVERLRQLHPDGVVLVVSHADVIKAVIATHLRLSLDHLEQFDIGCGSLSALDVGQGWSQVKWVNAQPA
jgi:probable phosphoglycerate mutase